MLSQQPKLGSRISSPSPDHYVEDQVKGVKFISLKCLNALSSQTYVSSVVGISTAAAAYAQAKRSVHLRSC